MSYPFPGALWVLRIPEATPSQNAYANKLTRGPYRKLQRRWRRLLTDAWYEARLTSLTLAGWQPPARARLTVFRASPRALDHDNLWGGLKPVIDGLRKLELIAGDEPDVLLLDVRATTAPACSTVLVLEHWPEAT